MTDIIFIYPKPGIDFSPSLPFPVLFPASTLIDNGFSVKIIDERVLKENKFVQNLKRAINSNPICVGISTMTGPQIKYALNTAELIKNKDPDIPLIWGGVHPTLLPEQTLQDERVDIVVRGEGEITILELVQKLEKDEKIDSIDGISFKDNNQIKHNKDRTFIDLNILPPLPYHLLDLKKYVQKTVMGNSIQMYTSRGCPFDCKFCYNNFYNKRIWRSWNVERILRELQFLIEKLNVNSTFFLDDNFFTNFKRIEKLMALFKKEKIDIKWSADCRVDRFMQMTNEFLNKIIDGGAYKFYIGAEAGSERVLKLINKGITPKDIIEANKRLSNYNIVPEFSFMMGFPTESMDEIYQTIDVIDNIISNNKKAIIALVKCYTPFPGTELFDLSMKLGFKPPKTLEEWSYFSYYDMKIPWLENKKKEIESISLVSRFITSMFVQYGIKHYLMKAYHPFAKLRWKYKIFTPFFDTFLLNYTKKMIFAT